MTSIFNREQLKAKNLKAAAESKAKLTEDIKELFATVNINLSPSLIYK